MRIHTFGKSRFWAVRPAGLSCLVVLIFAPSAHAMNAIGWIFANQPNATASYTPASQYSFNSAKGSVSVLPTNGEPGNYTVYFASLYQGAPQYVPDNVQVSVADGSSARCNPANWGPLDKTGQGPDTTGYVVVQCYDRQGHPANAAFTLLYQIRSAPFGSAADGLAFLVQGSGDSVAATSDSFNSRGGSNTVAKSNKAGIGAGNYAVTLPGMTRNGGNVQVSGSFGASNFGVPSQCKVVSWTPASSGASIAVQCYRDDNGNPIYDGFVLTYAIGEPFGLVPGAATLGAWAFANDLTSTNPYKPIITHQYNGFRTGSLTAEKTGTGKYTVTIPGTLTYSTSVALVTAVGAGNGYCNIADWSNATVDVVCYNQAGAPADSRFNVTLQTAK